MPKYKAKVVKKTTSLGGLAGPGARSPYLATTVPKAPMPVSTPAGQAAWQTGGLAPTAPKAPTTPPVNPGIEAYFNNAKSGALNERTQTWDSLKYGEGRAANDFGFKLNYTGIDLNKDGVVDTQQGSAVRGPDGMLAVDPSNPFSKMALLQRSYLQSQAGDMNSFAAMGQYTSGAYNRAKAETTHENNVQVDSYTKAFEDYLRGTLEGRTTAMNDYTGAVNSAAAERLRMLLGGP